MPGENPLFDLAPSGLDVLLEAGDLLDVGVLSTDAELAIRGWNQWLEVATGWSASEVIGRPLLSVFPEIRGTRAELAFRRAVAGETVMLAHRFHRWLLPLPSSPAFPEFDRMQQSARISPMTGGVEGAVAIIQDVTERVAREAELRAALEAAEAASKAKSEFMASISHELRTPLGAIIGYADILEGEMVGPLLETQKAHMRRIKSGATHLTGIIEQILTFARVEAGREEVHVESIDACAVSDEATALVAPQASQKGLRVLSTLPEGPVRLESDPGKVRQILINLLGNAVKFTETGEVELRVWTEDGMICFLVRDTGAGIPTAYLERVFEPFTQVDQSGTRAQGGTGLGLPVSRRLARLLGGDLAVESVLGQGSRFTLRVPVAPPASGEGAATPGR